MSEKFLRESRERIFAGVDRDLYLHVGYFLTWFNQVERQLTFLLARVMEMRDLEKFELLIGGMDARVKCERLKRACNNYRPMGPQLGARVDWFEDKVVKLRNMVAHRLVMKHDTHDTFYLTTPTRMPYRDIGGMDQIGPEPEQLPGLDFFEYGLWLNCFSEDLTAMLQSPSGELELTKPNSPASTEEIDRYLRQAENASRRKRAQKPPKTRE